MKVSWRSDQGTDTMKRTGQRITKHCKAFAFIIRERITVPCMTPPKSHGIRITSAILVRIGMSTKRRRFIQDRLQCST